MMLSRTPLEALFEATTDWTPGDDPETHPLWEQQVELERQMLKAGADKFRDRAIEAERRGQLTRLDPVRGLLTDWLPDVAKSVSDWCASMSRSKGGPKPIALPYLKQVDPAVASAIALREVLNAMSHKKSKVVGAAFRIGRLVEHEMRTRYWEKAAPGLYFHEKADLDKNKSTAAHRRKVNINVFNRLLANKEKEGLDLHWDDWSSEVQFRVGITLLDCIVRSTGWFKFGQDYEHTAWRKGGKPNSPQIIIMPREGMTKWLQQVMGDAELASPEFEPTIMPPKRWDGTKKGGYYTPYVRPPRLVRFKASQESQKEKAADEYGAIEMGGVLDSIHTLQETAYRINERVLDVVYLAWAKDNEIAKLPLLREKDLPVRTPRMAEHYEASREARAMGNLPPEPDAKTAAEIKKWKREATPVHRFNAKAASRTRSAKATVNIAEKYRHYDAIYFPHMLDFRGRIYPIPNFLQPQGDDLARGLLTFSEEAPILEGTDGADWLAIHLASVWGNDKVSFQKRIQWVHENEAMFRRIVEDPMASMEWATADKPWQSLAAAFEWVGFLEQGYGFMSSLPVMVDGTCNGIQHLAALTRDATSAKYVNLIPGDHPEDIYKHSAMDLQGTLERIEKAGGEEAKKATYWLDITGRDIPRSMTKRQVMVLPYGGTKEAFLKYTHQWLNENHPMPDLGHLPEEVAEGEWKERYRMVGFLVTHMWDSVSRDVKGGLEVMEWLKKCAAVLTVSNQPIYWVMPSGFVVRHFYGLDRSIKCEVKLDGERYQIKRAERTAKLSSKDQLQGIAPNFVHSCDASALMETVKLARAKGIRSMTTIHDAYGTHAANMGALNEAIREGFVAVHSQDLLGNFRAACQRVLVDHLVTTEGIDPFDAAEKAHEMLPEPLRLGDLELTDVLHSDYFFA